MWLKAVAIPSNMRQVITNSCRFSEASQCFPFFIFLTPNEKEMQDLRCTRSSHLNESSCYFKKHGTCDSQKLQFQRSVPLSSSCKIHIARLNTRQMPDCRQYWRKQFKVTSIWVKAMPSQMWVTTVAVWAWQVLHHSHHSSTIGENRRRS